MGPVLSLLWWSLGKLYFGRPSCPVRQVGPVPQLQVLWPCFKAESFPVSLPLVQAGPQVVRFQGRKIALFSIYFPQVPLFFTFLLLRSHLISRFYPFLSSRPPNIVYTISLYITISSLFFWWRAGGGAVLLAVSLNMLSSSQS